MCVIGVPWSLVEKVLEKESSFCQRRSLRGCFVGDSRVTGLNLCTDKDSVRVPTPLPFLLTESELKKIFFYKTRNVGFFSLEGSFSVKYKFKDDLVTTK